MSNQIYDAKPISGTAAEKTALESSLGVKNVGLEFTIVGGDTYIWNGSAFYQASASGAERVQVSNFTDYPQYSGTTVSYDLSATASPVLPSVTNYHYGQLIITLGAASTLQVQGRMADGTTVGNLTAIGPAGTRVVMNAAQLVPANNGLYSIDRFDCYDLVFVYVHGANSTIRGRLSGG